MKSKAPASEPFEAAVQRALKYLGYRPRSAAEVRTNLLQLGYSQPVTERALKKLREFNYVNDEIFARNWVQSRAENRGYGPRRIEQELKLKGIEQGTIVAVIREAFQKESEKAAAKKLLEQKFTHEKLKDERIMRRAVAFLLRRGYSRAVIDDLLRLPQQEPFDELC